MRKQGPAVLRAEPARPLGPSEGPQGPTWVPDCPLGLLQISLRGAGGAPAPRRTLPSLFPQSGPLILHPGPIYAVDGDRGIHQPIVYSIIRGEWAPAPNFSLHATP